MTGNGQQIVYFLHGLLATAHHHFGPQLRAWKDELAVVPVDLPGHGSCPLDANPHLVATAVRYALAVMNRFGPGHVIAASYLGSPVAVRSALQRPDLVQSLVLTGFAPDVPQQSFALWLESFGRLAAENNELTQWYEQTHGSRWPETLAAYTEDVRERYDEDVRVTWNMLSMLQPPALIANGAVKSNERNAATDAARLGPNMRGHVIQDAGHIPGCDRPEEFNRVVRTFWEETARKAALPPGQELLAGLQSALQETDSLRQLDSIEMVAVQAYLSRWGLEFPKGAHFPQTIKGWVEWAARYSTDS